MRRTLLLAALAVVQVAIVASLLRTAASPAVMEVATLEAPAVVSLDEESVELSDVVDTIHVLSGTPENGLDMDAGRLRQGLAYDRGHFSWVVLEDRPGPEDGLRKAVAPALGKGEAGVFEASLDDGTLSFFYDLGGRDEALDVNWTGIAQAEMQASPLLAWAKRIDFMVISHYDEARCGGLRRMLQGDPAVPILGPPLAVARLRGPSTPSGLAITVTSLMQRKRLLALPVGLMPLSPRLLVYTYPIPGSPEDWNAYASALVIRGRRGWAVCDGCGGISPDRLVAQVEQALGQPVVTWAGASGFEGASEDAKVVGAMEALHRSHPDLEMVPLHATSFTAHSMISRIFGADRYRAGVLGSRIHL